MMKTWVQALLPKTWNIDSPFIVTSDILYSKYPGTSFGETARSITLTLRLMKIIYFLEPVCVVSIVGPCRDGKSFILGEAFNQSDVFPVGFKMDPETMGIWIWILPYTMRVIKP